jgi:Uma2 family endonuclease
MSLPEQEFQRTLHRFSRAEYERMAEVGVFAPDARLELIDGEILTMPPQSTRHFTAILLAEEALAAAFGAAYHVRPQGPFAIDGRSEPEPDLAVVPGARRDFVGAHPSTAALIMEVADSSLGFDRIAKKRLYARNGIPEYWILDLTKARLEVYRGPAGEDYAQQRVLASGDRIRPLAEDAAEIRVADLLP